MSVNPTAQTDGPFLSSGVFRNRLGRARSSLFIIRLGCVMNAAWGVVSHGAFAPLRVVYLRTVSVTG